MVGTSVERWWTHGAYLRPKYTGPLEGLDGVHKQGYDYAKNNPTTF